MEGKGGRKMSAVGGTRIANFVERWGYGLEGMGFGFRQGEKIFFLLQIVYISAGF